VAIRWFGRSKAVKSKNNTNAFISCSVRLHPGYIQQFLLISADYTTLQFAFIFPVIPHRSGWWTRFWLKQISRT